MPPTAANQSSDDARSRDRRPVRRRATILALIGQFLIIAKLEDHVLEGVLFAIVVFPLERQTRTEASFAAAVQVSAVSP